MNPLLSGFCPHYINKTALVYVVSDLHIAKSNDQFPVLILFSIALDKVDQLLFLEIIHNSFGFQDTILFWFYLIPHWLLFSVLYWFLLNFLTSKCWFTTKFEIASRIMSYHVSSGRPLLVNSRHRYLNANSAYPCGYRRISHT